MKKTRILTLSVLLIVLLCSQTAKSEDTVASPTSTVDPCSQVTSIQMGRQTIADILRGYKNNRYLYDGSYYLCFRENDLWEYNDASDLGMSIDGDSVHIINLNLRSAQSHTFKVTSRGAHTFIKNLTLGGFNSGLTIDGLGVAEITEAKITCSDQSGIGLSILSPGTTVTGSQISGCGTGILIDNNASDVLIGAADAAHYEADKNVISGNAVGIHQITGAKNIWAYNSICGGDGIVVDGGARPSIKMDENSIVDLYCEKEDNLVKQCFVGINSVPEAAGVIEFYKYESQTCNKQGEKYIAQCVISDNGRCVFDVNNSALIISNVNCAEGNDYGSCRFTALFTGLISSMYSDKTFVFRAKPWSTVPAVEIPFPVEVGERTSQTGGDQIASNQPVVSDQPIIGSDQLASNSGPEFQGEIPNPLGPSSAPVEDVKDSKNEAGTTAPAMDGLGSAAALGCSVAPGEINGTLFYLLSLAGLLRLLFRLITNRGRFPVCKCPINKGRFVRFPENRN